MPVKPPDKLIDNIVARVREVIAHDVLEAEHRIAAHVIRHPDDLNLLTARAYVETAYGRDHESERLLQERLTLGLDPPALLRLVLQLASQGRSREAAAHVARHGVVDDPDVHASRLVLFADIEGRGPSAHAALLRCPEAVRRWYVAKAGVSALQRNDLHRASALASWAAELPGEAPEYHYLAALLAIRARDIRVAEREISRYRESGGGEATFAFAEGMLFARRSRRSEALARYEAAALLRPGWTHAHREAGLMAIRLKRWDDMERHAAALQSALPTDAAALRFLSALRRGRFLEALRALRGSPKRTDC